MLHLAFSHNMGSTSPIITFTPDDDSIKFSTYFLVKDLFGFVCILFLFLFIVFFYPNLLGHPDNYIQANQLATPAHIVPEWYFLPFYAILRSIPNKLGGVLLMFGSIFILFILKIFGNFLFIKRPDCYKSGYTTYLIQKEF